MPIGSGSSPQPLEDCCIRDSEDACMCAYLCRQHPKTGTCLFMAGNRPSQAPVNVASALSLPRGNGSRALGIRFILVVLLSEAAESGLGFRLLIPGDKPVVAFVVSFSGPMILRSTAPRKGTSGDSYSCRPRRVSHSTERPYGITDRAVGLDHPPAKAAVSAYHHHPSTPSGPLVHQKRGRHTR